MIQIQRDKIQLCLLQLK